MDITSKLSNMPFLTYFQEADRNEKATRIFALGLIFFVYFFLSPSSGILSGFYSFRFFIFDISRMVVLTWILSGADAGGRLKFLKGEFILYMIISSIMFVFLTVLFSVLYFRYLLYINVFSQFFLCLYLIFFLNLTWEKFDAKWKSVALGWGIAMALWKLTDLFVMFIFNEPISLKLQVIFPLADIFILSFCVGQLFEQEVESARTQRLVMKAIVLGQKMLAKIKGEEWIEIEEDEIEEDLEEDSEEYIQEESVVPSNVAPQAIQSSPYVDEYTSGSGLDEVYPTIQPVNSQVSPNAPYGQTSFPQQPAMPAQPQNVSTPTPQGVTPASSLPAELVAFLGTSNIAQYRQTLMSNIPHTNIEVIKMLIIRLIDDDPDIMEATALYILNKYDQKMISYIISNLFRLLPVNTESGYNKLIQISNHLWSNAPDHLKEHIRNEISSQYQRMKESP